MTGSVRRRFYCCLFSHLFIIYIIIFEVQFSTSVKASPLSGRVLHQHVRAEVLKLTFQKKNFLSSLFGTEMRLLSSRNVSSDSDKHLRRSSVFLCAFFSLNLSLCGSEEVAPEKCLVSGPGLNPNTVVPVRFFYIQAVNNQGENFTFSPGKS